MRAPVCSRSGCRSVRIERPDGRGGIAWECSPCKRNASGYCRDCPRILDDPNAMRCKRCRRARKTFVQVGSQRRRRADDPVKAERDCAKKRAARRDPVKGARIRELARAARRRRIEKLGKRPSDGFDKAYKRAWYQAAAQDPAWRAHDNARRRERYQTDPEYRERQKAEAKASYHRRRAAAARDHIANESRGESRRAS